jgi:small-conductance mechanosensitive channel
MSKDIETVKTLDISKKRPIAITFIGAIITMFLIIATLEVSHRNINTFVSDQEKYIVAIEATILSILIVEMLVRLITLRFNAPQLVESGTRLRLIVRIVGYSIALLSIVSILASNTALGISVGAIAGVVIAFAAQNIVGSMLATVLILNTRMVRVGEEITIGQTKGIVSEINLTHTVLSIDEDVVFVPNSLIGSSIVRRKKRNSHKDTSVHNW